MSVEPLVVRSIKGPEWVHVGFALATLAVIAWESWEARSGNDRPALKVAVGIMLSFLGGMSVERGIGLFRSGMSVYDWFFELLAGVGMLVLAITYFTRQKARPGPRSIIEWLNEGNKPPLLLDKKDD